MTRVKICGLTRYKDALRAESLGADYLGMVFCQKSRRLCCIKTAKQIIEKISKPKKVLVFGYDEHDYIIDIFSHFPERSCLLQLPSDHSSFTRLVNRFTPACMIVSVPVQDRIDDLELSRFKGFHALILDTGGQKDAAGEPMPGGTGVSFDWQHAKGLKTKYFLAGGLSDQNIASAFHLLKPYGVDASSGLEKKAGVKDHKKLALFMKKLRRDE